MSNFMPHNALACAASLTHDAIMRPAAADVFRRERRAQYRHGLNQDLTTGNSTFEPATAHKSMKP